MYDKPFAKCLALQLCCAHGSHILLLLCRITSSAASPAFGMVIALRVYRCVVDCCIASILMSYFVQLLTVWEVVALSADHNTENAGEVSHGHAQNRMAYFKDNDIV